MARAVNGQCKLVSNFRNGCTLDFRCLGRSLKHLFQPQEAERVPPRRKTQRGAGDASIGDENRRIRSGTALVNGAQNGRTLLSAEEWQQVGNRLGLSCRELELVQHIFDGKKLRVIARDMFLSIGTVKTYSQRIHHKLKITDQRELILAVVSSVAVSKPT